MICRKMLPKWTSQVSVSVAGGAQVPIDDGHSWRKYGQKDIVGAKYPRLLLNTKSLLALHSPQDSGMFSNEASAKIEKNTSVFDITDRGTHTCSSSRQQTTELSSWLYETEQSLLNQQNNWAQHHDFQTCLKVEIESSYTKNQDPTTSFSFPSTPLDGNKPESELFCTSKYM